MKKTMTKIWKSYSIGVVVVIVGIVLSLLTPRFMSMSNLLNVMTNASLVAIMGLGMTLAIASGATDVHAGIIPLDGGGPRSTPVALGLQVSSSWRQTKRQWWSLEQRRRHSTLQ